ncbi:MAG: decarboxylating 6-phosphogluconate dehydrogenase [Firmicutes bacterium]|nr:decarboxylating 6-phosphogluconate dehydrogenase [Bacillota bacterium]
MKIGIIGLGRMGRNMAQRLIKQHHDVVGFDRDAHAVSSLQEIGAQGAESLNALVDRLPQTPRIVWVMVPAGDPTEKTIATLLTLLAPGDIIIDGGNANFHDSMRRYQLCSTHGIAFLDAGTSGGVWGLQNGYCLMIGGDDDAFRTVEPIFAALAPSNGYLHTGPAGSGHFTKMVHNGIEYGMLQAYGEGFEIMEKAPFDLNLEKISALWNQGSVVRSWLLELLADAYQSNPQLDHIRGYVEDSGEGRWTIEEAIAEAVPAPVITAALFARFASRQDESYSAKVIAALRHAFGGHTVKE